jgi:hypothetical protein
MSAGPLSADVRFHEVHGYLIAILAGRIQWPRLVERGRLYSRTVQRRPLSVRAAGLSAWGAARAARALSGAEDRRTPTGLRPKFISSLVANACPKVLGFSLA